MGEQLAALPLKKRAWCYAQPPSVFEMAACSCGNHDTQWSEYEKHLWCDKCQKDFLPEHGGIFDGPIPVAAARMMGVSFDRINLVTNRLEVFDPDSCDWSVN